jgi:cephalosporin hydroxylase
MNPLPEILKEIDHRDNIASWLNKHNLVGTAAEVGVMHGGYSKHVLKDWRGQKYYMIDLWDRQDKEIYREKTDDINYDVKYREAKRVADADPRVFMLRGMSVDMAPILPDDSLDWVFIDANHSYKAVLEDMDAYFPKVKSGGLFSGHDFYNERTYPYFNEVQDAVERWSKEHEIPFYVTKCSSWWMVKP